MNSISIEHLTLYLVSRISNQLAFILALEDR